MGVPTKNTKSLTQRFQWEVEVHKDVVTVLSSDLYVMEDDKSTWYFWLCYDKNRHYKHHREAPFLSLNLPVCEYNSGQVRVECVGRVNASFDSGERINRFSAYQIVTQGESLILLDQFNASIFYEYTDNKRIRLNIEGDIVVETEITTTGTSGFMSRHPNLFNDFDQLLEEQVYGDVTLVAEGRELLAYKGILAARSPVFAAMFENDMQKKRAEIDDISHDVLKELVRYMYTGEISNLKEISTTLFIAADKYQLSALKEICESAACSTLTVSNVSMNLVYSALHNGTKLKSAAIKFIRKNKQEVIKSEEWKNILRDYPVLLVNSVLADLF